MSGYITAGSRVKFRSPDDGRKYQGTVVSVDRNGIAKIRYVHDYGVDSYEQHEYLNVLRLETV
jgi:hypothetical protein